jgi:hypothetical protein
VGGTRGRRNERRDGCEEEDGRRDVGRSVE